MRGQVALCGARARQARVGTTNVLSAVFSLTLKSETAEMYVELMLVKESLEYMLALRCVFFLQNYD